MKRRKGITYYSEEWPGSHSNYEWSVRFDITDGILGITQMHMEPLSKDEQPLERVLFKPTASAGIIEVCRAPGGYPSEQQAAKLSIAEG